MNNQNDKNKDDQFVLTLNRYNELDTIIRADIINRISRQFNDTSKDKNGYTYNNAKNKSESINASNASNASNTIMEMSQVINKLENLNSGMINKNKNSVSINMLNDKSYYEETEMRNAIIFKAKANFDKLCENIDNSKIDDMTRKSDIIYNHNQNYNESKVQISQQVEYELKSILSYL